MSIERDDRDERKTRIDGMIEEFRKAQSKRLARVPPKVPDAGIETAGKMPADECVTDADPLMDGKTRCPIR